MSGRALHAHQATSADRPWWKGKPKPKYPHDWRWFVGGIGRTFITAGVLIFAFVAYQLWGTGLHFAAAQDRLAAEFGLQLSTTTAVPTTALPALTPPTGADGSTPAPPVVTAAATTIPATTPAPTTAPAAPVAPFAVELGDPIAVIDIPKINLKTKYIVAGVRTSDLRDGIGHFPGTPQPGQLGNASLAGHRTSFGAPFGNIDKLGPGDVINVATPAGQFRYVVDAAPFIVNPKDVWVLTTFEPDIAKLTLTSCDPKYTSKRRIVVTATLSAPESALPAAPEPFYGSDEIKTAELEDAQIDVEITDPETGEPVEATASSETLEQGWFSDPDAYPGLGLWAGILAAIALLAWFISHKTRKLIGVTLMLVPFVVALFLWFGYVNRLLPPNL